MKLHYTEKYLLNPPHKVTVDLIGLGGTGSQVLTNLGRMNTALIGLGHPGLHVRCWDDDKVSPSNIGRQLFSPADIGINKAIVLVSRLNSFYGFDWEVMPEKFHVNTTLSNITITCVDTAAARIEIANILKGTMRENQPTDKQYYWLDLGNLQKTGQAVMGTLRTIDQPKDAIHTCSKNLKTVIELLPQIKKIKEKEQGPSCSLAEALHKQDLFINSTLAQFGCNLIWKLFREGCIRFQGCYVNLESLIVNPIKI